MDTVRDFADFKTRGRRISIVTAYDAWSAGIIGKSNVDAILVGDSVSMVVHGHPSTLSATVDMMVLHTEAVVRAGSGKFVIADMPFLSYRKGVASAVDAAGALMRAGAQAVKLEGVDGHEDVIRHIVGSGVPVMGHLGLTPQSVHQLGGYRVQGRGDAQAEALRRQARALEDLGCFAVVLECIPEGLATEITAAASIPTIGIGAGLSTDGQVLVLQDLWGINKAGAPRFVRAYLEGDCVLAQALNRYDADVKGGQFPGPQETYS